MFTIFQNSTTAYANEVMNNFYHFANGGRLPRGAGSMTAADSTYNLGSSANRWKNLYANNLFVNDSISCDYIFKKFSSYEQSSGSTDRVAFTGLNGDSYDYIISIGLIGPNTSTGMEMRLNQSSGTTDYNQKFLNVDTLAGTSSLITTGAAQLFPCHYTGPGTRSFFYGYLYAKTSKLRICSGIEYRSGGTGIYKTIMTWENIADTLTAISFPVLGSNPFGPGSKITLWEVPN